MGVSQPRHNRNLASSRPSHRSCRSRLIVQRAVSRLAAKLTTGPDSDRTRPLAADGLQDLTDREVVVPGQRAGGFTGPEAFRDHLGRNAGPHEDRAPKGHEGVNHHRLRGATDDRSDERVAARWPRLLHPTRSG